MSIKTCFSYIAGELHSVPAGSDCAELDERGGGVRRFTRQGVQQSRQTGRVRGVETGNQNFGFRLFDSQLFIQNVQVVLFSFPVKSACETKMNKTSWTNNTH